MSESDRALKAQNVMFAEPVGATIFTLCSVLSGGVSGGDLVITHLAKHWPGPKAPIVVTTQTGAELLASSEYSVGAASVNVVDHGLHEPHSALLAYGIRVWRVLKAIRTQRGQLAKQTDRLMVVCGSPYIPDLVAYYALSRTAALSVLSWQLSVARPKLPFIWKESAHHRRPSLYGVGKELRQCFSYLNQEIAFVLARRLGSAVLVPSDQMAEFAANRGIPNSRIIRMPCGVDRFVAVESARTRQHHYRAVGEPSLRFVFIGRFHPQKGVDDLLTVWRHLVQISGGSGIAVSLDVIGGGDTRFAEGIVRALRRLPGTVRYHGPITGDRKYAILSKAHTLLFPSKWESFGIVALEALSIGVPVVGYELPSTREVFGPNVRQVSYGDVRALATAAWETALHDSWGCAERRRQWAAEYSWPRLVGRAYGDIMAVGAGSRGAELSGASAERFS